MKTETEILDEINRMETIASATDNRELSRTLFTKMAALAWVLGGEKQ